MSWDWSSFFGTAIGCALGWFVFPRLGRWLKHKCNFKGDPTRGNGYCTTKKYASGDKIFKKIDSKAMGCFFFRWLYPGEVFPDPLKD